MKLSVPASMIAVADLKMLVETNFSGYIGGSR